MPREQITLDEFYDKFSPAYKRIQKAVLLLNDIDIERAALSAREDALLDEIWLTMSKIPTEDRKIFAQKALKEEQSYMVAAIAKHAAELYNYGGSRYDK